MLGGAIYGQPIFRMGVVSFESSDEVLKVFRHGAQLLNSNFDGWGS